MNFHLEFFFSRRLEQDTSQTKICEDTNIAQLETGVFDGGENLAVNSST